MKSSCTFGLGILFKYIRGLLKSSEMSLLKVFTQRLKKFFGLLLPKCARGDMSSSQKETYIQESEDHIVKHVLKRIDTPPPPSPSTPEFTNAPDTPPEQWFSITPTQYHSLTSLEKED